jgi:hypothetical protein
MHNEADAYALAYGAGVAAHGVCEHVGCITGSASCVRSRGVEEEDNSATIHLRVKSGCFKDRTFHTVMVALAPHSKGAEDGTWRVFN